MIKMYKITGDMAKVDREKFFFRSQNTRTRDHAMKLKLVGRRFKRDKRKNTFKQHIITLWNSLSQDLVITTNGCFK